MAARFEFFRNLTTGAFSIRQRGKVIARSNHVILLKDVKLVVQPAGQEKAIREQTRNVHAFVTGLQKPQKNLSCRVHSIEDLYASLPPGTDRSEAEIFRISYNPKDERKVGFFNRDTGEPLGPDQTYDWALGLREGKGVAVYVGRGVMPELIRKAIRWSSVPQS